MKTTLELMEENLLIMERNIVKIKEHLAEMDYNYGTISGTN
jgi:hypothetical protein